MMPDYRVKCLKCGKKAVKFSRMAERGTIQCECGGATKIIPSCGAAYIPGYCHPERQISKEAVTEKSGLVIQGEKHGF